MNKALYLVLSGCDIANYERCAIPGARSPPFGD
jgi:hypothetical protein